MSDIEPEAVDPQSDSPEWLRALRAADPDVTNMPDLDLEPKPRQAKCCMSEAPESVRESPKPRQAKCCMSEAPESVRESPKREVSRWTAAIPAILAAVAYSGWKVFQLFTVDRKAMGAIYLAAIGGLVAFVICAAVTIIMIQRNPEEDRSSTVSCPNCGRENSTHTQICPRCDLRLTG